MFHDTPLHALVVLAKHHAQVLEAIRAAIRAKTPHADLRENLVFDAIPQGALGSTQKLPYTHATEKWNTDGLPYGAWCRCSKCNRVGRSTVGFCFFASGDGAALDCEVCALRDAAEPETETTKA